MTSRLLGPDGKALLDDGNNKRPQGEGRSKAAIALISALAGFLFGGGGVFGVVKWIDMRDLAALQGQYEAAKSQAELAETYRKQRDALEEKLRQKQSEGGSDESQQRIQRELRIVNENLDYLLSRQDLPGWAQERARQAQRAARKIGGR